MAAGSVAAALSGPGPGGGLARRLTRRLGGGLRAARPPPALDRPDFSVGFAGAHLGLRPVGAAAGSCAGSWAVGRSSSALGAAVVALATAGDGATGGGGVIGSGAVTAGRGRDTSRPGSISASPNGRAIHR